MLDKEKDYNMDEQFTHDAWLNMKQMLDAEMPVEEKKKRRGAFWWRFGAVGVAAVILGLWLMYPTFNVIKDQNKEASINQIVSTENTAKENSTDKLIHAEAEASTAISAKELLEKSKNNPRQNQSATNEATTKYNKFTLPKAVQNNNTTLKKTPTQQNNSVNISRVESSIPSTFNKTNETNVSAENAVIKLNTDKESKESAKEEKAAPPIASNHLPRLLSLPNDKIRTGSLSPLSLTIEEKPLPVLTTKKPRSWLGNNLSWGAEIGSQSANLRKLNGLHAGLFANIRMTPTFYLSTGIHYNLMQYETDFGGFNNDLADNLGTSAPEVNDTIPFGTDPSVALDQEEKESIYNQTIRQTNFHLLSIPIQINYRLSPKWSAGAGLRVSYLLYGASGGQENTSTIRTGNFLNTYAGRALDEAFNYNIIRRWDLALNAGVNFQIIDRLGLGLQYNAVLFKNKSKFNKSSIQNNALQASLKYNF